MMPKKPMPTTMPGDPMAKLPLAAMAGEGMNSSALPDDLASIKSKLKANKKSLPGVGFKPPMGSKAAKKAASSVKKAHKKMKGNK
jgi:hypothetical protein